MNEAEAAGLVEKVAGRYPRWKPTEVQKAAWADELVSVSIEAALRAIGKLADNGFDSSAPSAMQFRRLCYQSVKHTDPDGGCRLGCGLPATDAAGVCTYHFHAPVNQHDLVTRRINHYRMDLDYVRWLHLACAVEIVEPQLYDTPQSVMITRQEYPLHENESPLLYRSRVEVEVRNKILEGLLSPVPVPLNPSDHKPVVPINDLDQAVANMTRNFPE